MKDKIFRYKIYVLRREISLFFLMCRLSNTTTLGMVHIFFELFIVIQFSQHLVLLVDVTQDGYTSLAGPNAPFTFSWFST